MANGGLFISGDAPKRGGLDSFAGRRGVDGRIRISRWLGHFEMPCLLRQIHVLVPPKRTVERYKEQFGYVLIEAMSAGVVSVGYSLWEIPHVAGEDGFNFPENESTALAGIPQDLLDRSSLPGRLAVSGRIRAVSEFGWNMTSEKTHAIYERVLSGEGAGYGAEDE